jgi:hypothetical protein
MKGTSIIYEKKFDIFYSQNRHYIHYYLIELQMFLLGGSGTTNDHYTFEG